MQRDQPHAEDEALACLRQLAASAAELSRRVSRFRDTGGYRVAGGGLQYTEMLPLPARLMMIEQISEAIKALASDGSRFRRMEARALYAEGLTMAQLAAVFGVSRQRVSVLLRDADNDVSGSTDDDASQFATA